MAENSVLDLAFGTLDYHLNFVGAHSCLQVNTDRKWMSRHTTVNDIQMEGCLDPKIFVNCLLYVQEEAFNKDLTRQRPYKMKVKTRVETNAKVGFEYSFY